MINPSPEPILFITAIILTIMATYTSVDLLSLVKSTERNSQFLFLGGIASMSIGLWIMNFLIMSSVNENAFVSYDIPSAILSFIIGITFTYTSFYLFLNKRIHMFHLLFGSLFMTTAVVSTHLFGVFSLHLSIQYNLIVTVISLTIVFASFLITFWLLYSTTATGPKKGWIRPLSSILITIGAGQAYYALTVAATIKSGNNSGLENNFAGQSIAIYIALFISLLMLGGLLLTNTLISKRLERRDTYIRDISAALDVSSIVAITDPRGRITYANDKFVEISKYSKEEIIGQNHQILNSGYHPKSFFKELWKTIGTGHVWKGEIRNRAKDGSYYWVDTTIVPFMNSKGKPYQYLAIRNDITEKKKTEELIHRSDKLAVVGQLAAGVAHEIRNPLTSMKGYAEFLTLDEDNKERKEYLEIILDEIERVDTIVEDFMVLAKPTVDKVEIQNIIPVMKDVLSLLDYEARKGKINLQFTYNREEINAVIDENRMKQVFLNFVKNAIEAMPNGGDLFVNITEEENQIDIRIQDTGVGIKPEKLKRIGEPFYTTKTSGTGLGLMTSFKIVESHRGNVFVESVENKGTEFHIVLPKPERG